MESLKGVQYSSSSQFFWFIFTKRPLRTIYGIFTVLHDDLVTKLSTLILPLHHTDSSSQQYACLRELELNQQLLRAMVLQLQYVCIN